MRVSLRGIVEIISHEGIVTSPYYDSRGVLTFGVGHTASAGNPDPKKLPKGVPQPFEYIFEVFRADLRRFERRVNKAINVKLKQHQFDALVSFDYNTGGIHRAKLTRLINEGKMDEAAKAFMGWSKPKEIVPRRKKEQHLFLTGEYGDDTAMLWPADENGKVEWGNAQRVDVLELMGERKPEEPEERPEGMLNEVVLGGIVALVILILGILGIVFLN